MSWKEFTKPATPWTVTFSSHPDVGVGDILTFLGSGSRADSKMTHTKGDWENAEFVGGSGTDAKPDVVTLSCRGKDHYIQRSGKKLACHAGPLVLGPFATHENQGGGPGGEGSNPTWEAQEGGNRKT